MYYKLWLVSLLHALLGASSYFNLCVLNPLEPFVRQLANRTLERWSNGSQSSRAVQSSLWSLLNASYPCGFLLCSLFLHWTAERLGRRGTVMLLSSFLLLFASVLGPLAVELDLFELLLLSRLLAGISDQLCMFVYVFVMECGEPDDARLAGGIIRVGGMVWYVLGAVAGLPACLGAPDTWHYALAIPAVPALLYAIATPSVCESPKHLLITLDKEDEAKEAIEFYYGRLVDKERLIEQFKTEAVDARDGFNIGVVQIIKIRHLRWPFILCVLANFANRMGGYDIENFYSTGIMRQLGVSEDWLGLFNVVLLRVPSLFLSILSVFLVQRLSTRTFLLWTLLMGAVAISLLCVSQSVNVDPIAKVGAISSLMLGISGWHLGAAFLPKVLPGEICPQLIRSLSTAYGVAVAGATSIVITFGYAPISDLIGQSWTLAPMVAFSWASFVWLYKYLPDTKHKSINEIIESWMEPDEDNDETIEFIQLF